MGQGSCVSSINDCCPFFDLNNMCTTSCPTNYVASANTNFTCGKEINIHICIYIIH